MRHRAITHTPLRRLVAVLMLAAAQSRAAENPGAPQRIVVSIPDRKLALIEDGTVVKIYDIAVGKAATPSPQGTFEVVNRVVNPTWYGPNKKVVRPGKANPVGTRWMGLSARGYGIHGTNHPDSIGKAASKGCIRMRNADVEELFDLVRVGATVELSAETSELFQPQGESHVVAEVPVDGDRSLVAARSGDHPRP